MTVFFFVRHAVTPETGKRLSGWTRGVHLSEEGVAQAEGAASILDKAGITALYSSPVDRALETARIIGSRIGVDTVVRKGLGEVRFGTWTNRSFGTLRRTKLWAEVQRRPSAIRFPNGESLREVQVRAVEEVEGICASHPRGKVCCVSHADVIKLLAAHYLGMHMDFFQRIVVAPASVSVVALGGGAPQVVALNTAPQRTGEE